MYAFMKSIKTVVAPDSLCLWAMTSKLLPAEQCGGRARGAGLLAIRQCVYQRKLSVEKKAI
jgi:hypothetical protein